MKTVFVSSLLFASLAFAAAPAFSVSSTDITEGKSLKTEQVANTFGCSGGNLSPQLSFKNVPAGTKSLAVTIYDPDAPTGSGWWHWVVYDIPADTAAIAQGGKDLPATAKQGHNDGGKQEFMGACPPEKDKAHHYIVTVFALKVDKLEVPADASSAMIGFMLNANALGKAKLTGTYKR